MTKFPLEKGADPTISTSNSCIAMDLATLVEENDT